MKVLALILAVATLYALCQGFEDKSVATYLSDNAGSYSTLVTLLIKAGLMGVLNGSGPYTIFAPTNTAFKQLNATNTTLLADLIADPAALNKVLRYHVIPEFVLTPMVQGNDSRQTLEGQALELASTGVGGLGLKGFGSVKGSGGDIVVNNGVVQPIDFVMFPPVASSRFIAEILLKDDARFKDFYMSLMILDLIPLLEVAGGDFTVFAPVDSGYLLFNDSRLDVDFKNPVAVADVYKEMLKYHIVPGTRYARQLNPLIPVFTLHGAPLHIDVKNGVMMVDDARVIEADIPARNGVIHVIDRRLIPSDIIKH